MTDDEVLAAAYDHDGLELVERPLGDRWVWGWQRGDDTRFPCYRERRQAIDYMDDRLRRTRTFER